MDAGMKQYRAELKLNATQMKGLGETTELLKNRQSILESELSNSREKVALLNLKLTEAKRIFGENSTEVQTLSRQLTEAKNQQAAIQNELGETNTKLKEQAKVNKELENSVSQADSKLKMLDRELELNSAKTEGASKKTTLLKERKELLGRQAQASAEKVRVLEQALETCGREAGENSEEYAELKARLLEAQSQQESIRNAIKATTEELAEQKSTLELAGEGIGKFGRNVEQAGNNLRAVSAATGGVLAGAGAAAISFESAFAGVKKTTDEVFDANGRCIYSYQQLEDGIRQMAKEIPSSTTEISEVAEAAGQLGIKTEDILGFTRVMIDMGNSTNLASEEASSAIAKFANVTGLAADETMSAEEKYSKMGSTIVELGNNYATTEADIMAMAQNLASAGTQVGMSESDILALATALSSVGMEAQAGGTAFSKALIAMQLAVETNSESLKDWARVAGMSADEFSQKFREDATGALEAFITGLSNCGGETDSAIKVLDDMGITETRLRDSLLRSANASDVFSSAIETGRDAWEENTALQDEASKRYETTASQIQIMKNHFVDAGVTLGSVFLPMIQEGIKKVTGFADAIAGMDKWQQEAVLGILAFITVLSPLLIGIGKISIGISALIGVGSKLTGMFAGIGGAATEGGAAAGAAMAVPLGPILAIVAGITAVIGVFALLWNKSESFRDFFTGMWKGLKETVSDFVKKIDFGDKIESIKEKFSGLGEKLAGLENLFKAIGIVAAVIGVGALTILAGVFHALLNAAEPLITILGGVIDILSGLGDIIFGVFTGDAELVKQGAQTLVSGIGSVFEGLWDLVASVLTGFVDGIVVFFTSLLDVCGANEFIQGVVENFKGIASGVSEVFSSAVDTVSEVFSDIANTVSETFTTIGNVVQAGLMFIGELFSFGLELITVPFRFIWENCSAIISNVWTSITATVSAGLGVASGIISTVFGAVAGFIAGIWNSIWVTISNVWTSITATVSAGIGTVSGIISAVFGVVAGFIAGIWNSIWVTISNAWTAITAAVSAGLEVVNGIINAVFGAIAGFIAGIWSGIKGTIANAWSAISAITSAATDTIGGIVQAGFQILNTYIVNPISQAYATVSGIFDEIRNAISTKIESARDAVGNAIEAIKGFFNFSWSLPKLKLPHIKISGKFSIDPPSAPSFGIEWYAKGAIFNKPTILTSLNGLKGVGEAGPEAIAPISKLKEYMESAVDRTFQKYMYARNDFDYDKLAAAFAKQRIIGEVNGREVVRMFRDEGIAI